MNDTTAAFKEVKDAKKLKRAANISTAIALLERSGVSYTESAKDKNGVKLRVQSIRKSYDFWPESSTWRLRGGEVTHRGVYKLLGQLAKDGVILKSEASSAVLSTAELGAAVIVRGVVVAWFSALDEAARDWCTANHFGEWLVWQAKKPELIRLTDEQIARIESDAAALAAKFKEASN